MGRQMGRQVGRQVGRRDAPPDAPPDAPVLALADRLGVEIATSVRKEGGAVYSPAV